LFLICAHRLTAVGPRLGFKLAVDEAGVASSTRGFVGDTVFAVLPNVKPVHCFLLTIALQVVRPTPSRGRASALVLHCLTRLTRDVSAVGRSSPPSSGSGQATRSSSGRWPSRATRPSSSAGMCMRRLCCSSLCRSGAFFLSLAPSFDSTDNVIRACSLLAAESYALYRTFVLASVAGIFSLFPLLFTPLGASFHSTPLSLSRSSEGLLIIPASVALTLVETPIKIGYSVLWCAFAFPAIARGVYRCVQCDTERAHFHLISVSNLSLIVPHCL
jgi:hypothetical protein